MLGLACLLIQYTSTTHNLIVCLNFDTKIHGNRMEVVVIVRADMPETAAGTNVVVRVPVPRDAVSVSSDVSVGKSATTSSSIYTSLTVIAIFLESSFLESFTVCAEYHVDERLSNVFCPRTREPRVRESGFQKVCGVKCVRNNE